MSNVLVYSGPGVSASSLSHTLRTLQRLLPSYDVQCVNAQSLAVDPWMDSTALLVIPGGRDLPYVEKLGERHYANSTGSNGAAHRAPGSSRMAQADARIREYVVEHGGAFLGICAGAYYASSVCEFERGDPVMEVIGERPALRFYPGTCRGTVYPGFVYESDDGARLVALDTADHQQPWQTYYNGGGAFIDAEAYEAKGVEVLARYVSDREARHEGAAAGSSSHAIKAGYAGQVAAVLCSAGRGSALLYGTHPEFPATATAGPSRKSGAPEATASTDSSFKELECDRLAVFGSHLQKLGLQVLLPEADKAEQPLKLTPLVLAAKEKHSLDQIKIALQATDDASHNSTTLQSVGSRAKLATVVDANDTIHLYSHDDASSLFRACASADYTPFLAPVTTPANADAARAGQNEEPELEVDLHRVPKYLIVASDPSSLLTFTPHWDSSAYFQAAEDSRALIAQLSQREEWAGAGSASAFASSAEADRVRIGDVLTYALVVTSTQTMLDKNFKLLTRLPNGLTSFATHQISGRGRGKNAWISPLGCLQFSVLLRVPQPQQVLWHAGMSSIVFVQYLAGLAIVESVRSGALGEVYARAIGSKIRIKWPNDVYAEVEDLTQANGDAPLTERKGTFDWRAKRYAKMAGVLVNSQFAGTELALVVGCGINTLNPRPTTSLSDLIEGYNAAHPDQAPLPVVSQERFAGAILATFERIWTTFLQAGGSFAPFVEAYRRAWLHSDQDTLLKDTEPPTRARIVGVTTDHGLLRCVPLPADPKASRAGLADTYSPGAWGMSASAKTRAQPANFIDLQPDGNSFDMLQNLIRRKE